MHVTGATQNVDMSVRRYPLGAVHLGWWTRQLKPPSECGVG